MNAWLSCDEQCTQILTHRPDLRLGHIIDVIRTTLAKNELPIVNGNDAANISELKYTDNDNLSTRIAAMIRASWHISLTSTGGIQGENGKVISFIQPGDGKWLQFIRHEQSKNGRGGMRRKGRLSAWLADKKGIPASITGGKEQFLEQRTIEDILLNTDTLLRGQRSVGTTFLPNILQQS
ncbi:hypothetical protein A2765_01950 [Candidatus Kaiserbacteria bacterium RIFCSPHIGHO2_01_FULL_56_24]|uniref:Aspartate/glutamate/uridylate kinase domain-containing protein n=1 Tax=Candidatus Kaiserbacteria bacterium RIFCSPHIGHO2_01_FULL_56_24 TaxID=1798487 RepID=A0A1F6DDP8_9BACT|nr:MAG: hypothetical protein A2765_01950 [Candidatus Kaiserbacteria bacterium RIFCSPHIGHO2_01_FULL_56_24]